jgi:hypothetical protein
VGAGLLVSGILLIGVVGGTEVVRSEESVFVKGTLGAMETEWLVEARIERSEVERRRYIPILIRNSKYERHLCFLLPSMS